MEPQDHKHDTEKGCVKKKVVPIVRRVPKDITKEPEMVELKRMIKARELDRDRTIDYLKGEDRGED